MQLVVHVCVYLNLYKCTRKLFYITYLHLKNYIFNLYLKAFYIYMYYIYICGLNVEFRITKTLSLQSAKDFCLRLYIFIVTR